MKFLAIGAAALSMIIGGAAIGQVSTTQSQMPNGNVRTETRVETPGGTATTRTVDRADGSRAVVRQRTDVMGNERTVRRDSRHPGQRRVCVKRWSHGHRVTRCSWRRR